MMNTFLYHELEIGQSCSFSHQVTQEQQDLFCRLSGDINPLHLDANFARTKGYRGCIVYGMLTASLYSTLAGVYLPGMHCLLQRVDTAFIRPVFVGDLLCVEGRLVEKNDLFQQIKIKAAIYNQNQEKVSRAVIEAGVVYEQQK